MGLRHGISVLMVAMLTGQATLCDAAVGDWIRPVISDGMRTGTLPRVVPENQREGQTAEYVEVEGATSYRILSQSVDGLFALQNNGSLNITSGLDYEKETSYAIVVEALNGKGMTSTATVIVRIEDKNDNPPVFPGAPYLVVLPDNSTEGTFVMKVTATDSDRSVFMGNIKHYEIKSEMFTTESNYTYLYWEFFIASSSGEIYVGKDRQLSSAVKTNYTFTVVASDTGVPTRTGSADVTVCVANCPPEHLPDVESSTGHKNQNGDETAQRNGGPYSFVAYSSSMLLAFCLCLVALICQSITLTLRS